jgi:pimeloyl-ACP methyl ester carboxylesterase
LAELLAEDYTVVTYDPHGLGKSTVDDPSLDVTPEIEADDLAAVVDAVGAGKADVFGSSGGAVAGLAFATRHPDKLGTLIAHEPPVTMMLPDAPQILAVIDEIEDAVRAGEPGAGFQKFVGLVMHNGPVTEAGVVPVAWPPPGDEAPNGQSEGDGSGDANAGPPEPSAKQQADDEMFFLRMLGPFNRSQPDIDALRSGPRVVVAVGEASGAEIARRSAEALADRLGTEPVIFPGDHGGFMADPAAFAEAIRKVLAESR